MPDTTAEMKQRLESLLLVEDVWPRTRVEIAALGPDIVAPLAQLIRERPHDTKFIERAVLALGTVGAAPAAELLESLLDDPEPMIRIGAVTALRDNGDVHNAQAVEALLADPEPAVRKEAVKTLAQLGGADSVKALQGLAQADSEAFLREHAGHAAARAQRRLAGSEQDA